MPFSEKHKKTTASHLRASPAIFSVFNANCDLIGQFCFTQYFALFTLLTIFSFIICYFSHMLFCIIFSVTIYIFFLITLISNGL